WDIRSGQQIQVFSGHSNWVYAVEYSPFVVNIKAVGGNSNVICSASKDNTIRFWDIRSNKNQLYTINAFDNDNDDDGITCLKFVSLRKKRKCNKQKLNDHINFLFGKTWIKFVSKFFILSVIYFFCWN
ncbi:hypothetical protein RFI_04621, partial [Reticulomyxa filosa]